jgi:hypothetical protein
LIELARQRRLHPELSDNEAASKVALDVNKRFGNLQSQAWLKSKTGQSLFRLAFLAPQWNESLLRSEATGALQAGQAAANLARGRSPKAGMIARGIGTAVALQFLANQLINYGTRGKPTWENEEGEDQGAMGWLGAKISAYIPDVIGGGPGFFLNPLALPMEISHYLALRTERHAGDWAKATLDFMSGRLSSLARGAIAFGTGVDSRGRIAHNVTERITHAAEDTIPVPLSGGAAYHAAKQMATGEHQEKYAGEYEQKAFQAGGVKLERAPDAEKRIRDLAVRFNRNQNIQEEAGYHEGQFQPLTDAVRRGNMTDAQEELGRLLEMDRANGIKMEPADIAKHYAVWERSPFTHNRTREGAFYRSLSPAQQEVYQKAQSARSDVARVVFGLLNSRLQTQEGQLQSQ